MANYEPAFNSEVDPFQNQTRFRLGPGIYWLETRRYVKRHTTDQTLNRIEKFIDKEDQPVTVIDSGNYRRRKIDFLIEWALARMELSFTYRNYELN